MQMDAELRGRSVEYQVELVVWWVAVLSAPALLTPKSRGRGER